MENFRNKQFTSFKLHTVLNSVMKSACSALSRLWHESLLCPEILPAGHVIAVSVIRWTVPVWQCLCSGFKALGIEFSTLHIPGVYWGSWKESPMGVVAAFVYTAFGTLLCSGSCWWTGRPGVLRFMGSQRVRHNWVTELNWTDARCRHSIHCSQCP